MFAVSWEKSPLGLFLTVPLVCLWVERAETDYNVQPCSWTWSLLRLTIWKTEFRLELDLNLWGIGLTCVEFDDCGIYFGPFNIQIETGKAFDKDFTPGVPTLRLFFPPCRSVQPWSPRCNCDTLADNDEGYDKR